MAIYDATKNQVNYPLTFSKRDAEIEAAITEEHSIAQFRMLLDKGKPIPKALGEYILSLIQKKRPAHRPINLRQTVYRIGIGSSVDQLKGMGREKAIEYVANSVNKESDYVRKAHSLFMRLAGIKPRRGKSRQK